MLQRQADALPANTDPELRATYTHPAVIEQVAAMKQFPEAFKELPPTSFRTMIKSYEDDQRREKERPRLWTENPPQGAIEESQSYRLRAYFFALLCIPASIATVYVGVATYLGFGIATSASVLLLAWLSYNSHVKSHNLALRWETSYYNIVYSPALKSGKSADVEIQLELPVGWGIPEMLSRLENCAKPSLYELFAKSDTVPLRSKVWDCIERKLALKQRELGLSLCRMELLKCVDPAMPAFGSRHVFSSNGFIVTYEIADLWRTDAVNAKLAEMLAANPGTDLTRHAKTLNIHFIDIEKHAMHKGFAFNG
jgi:hypothetical protein